MTRGLKELVAVFVPFVVDEVQLSGFPDDEGTEGAVRRRCLPQRLSGFDAAPARVLRDAGEENALLGPR
jgi:hypothetical protein